MENMEYYTQRLQCSEEEKAACLETVAKLYRLRWYLRENGALAAGVLAEGEADPFFRACLMEIGDVFLHPEELERRYMQYLMAGDYRGGAFLNAVLISEGLVLLARYDGETSGTRFFTAKTGANCLAKPCGAILEQGIWNR